MARVVAFGVSGVETWFYSGDHRPPHFHARRLGHWEVRVYFLEPRGQMLELVRPPDAVMRGKDRRAIEAGAERHRAELLAEWEAAQSSE